jgi:hypothetical protein
MTMKSSSQHVKQIKKEIKKVLSSKKKIDYSDIPELDFNKLGKPEIGKFYRPNDKIK